MSGDSETVEDTKKGLLAEVTDDSCTAECVDRFCKPEFIYPVVEVKPEDLQEMKQEPDDENDNNDSHCYLKPVTTVHSATESPCFPTQVNSDTQRKVATSRTSTVWRYFTDMPADVTRVICSLCLASIARGGKGNSNRYGTTNLRKHLQAKHYDEYRVLMAIEARRSSSGETTSSFSVKRPQCLDDERSRRIHRLIGEMIATDDQPFNVVNNKGRQT